MRARRAAATNDRDQFEAGRAWQRELYDGGWAGISWPVEYGGRGATPAQASIFAEEQAGFGVSAGFVGSTIGMVGPVLLSHGSVAQRSRFLRPLLRADETWCQLFSEPSAGSDLANLATRADRDGDEFVVNGQKVWTSNAHVCDFAILLARTNPDVPKHRGITFFLLDLRTPGIEVRPLRQITGAAHFNEVFLTDVRVPIANVVGENRQRLAGGSCGSRPRGVGDRRRQRRRAGICGSRRPGARARPRVRSDHAPATRARLCGRADPAVHERAGAVLGPRRLAPRSTVR